MNPTVSIGGRHTKVDRTSSDMKDERSDSDAPQSNKNGADFWQKRTKELEKEVLDLKESVESIEKQSCRNKLTREKRVHDLVRELLNEELQQCPDECIDALIQGSTTRKDLRDLLDICHRLNSFRVKQVLESFFRVVNAHVAYRDQKLCERDAGLPDDWYTEPWYVLNPYSKSNKLLGFQALRDHLSHIGRLGIRNLLVHIHYESKHPMDVVDFKPRKDLGGEQAFHDFLQDAIRQGFRVMTDVLLTQTSTEHEWFQRAVGGSEHHAAYYVQVNGREKINECIQDGEVICTYRDPDGRVEQLTCPYPGIDRTHGLWVVIQGKTYQFFRRAYPTAVDLNLHNAGLLEEIFRLLASEMSAGILGKRLCDADHMFQQPSGNSYYASNKDTHAFISLLKSFIRHLNPRAIIMPHVKLSEGDAGKFFGMQTSIGKGVPSSSEGDLVPGNGFRAALLEMIISENVTPFWRLRSSLEAIPQGACWLQYLEHNEEYNILLHPPNSRYKMKKLLMSKGLKFDEKGTKYAGRFAECVDGDERRLAVAIFCLYMAPGTPAIFAGLEIGIQTDAGYPELAAKSRESYFKDSCFSTNADSCYDLRDFSRAPVRLESMKIIFDDRPSLEIIQRMDVLRRRFSPLRSNEVHPLNCGQLSILCMIRRDGKESLFCIANLSSESRECCVPVWQLERHLKISGKQNIVAVDLLTDLRMHLERKSHAYVFNVRAYQCLVLDCTVNNL